MHTEEMVLDVVGMHCDGCAGTVGGAAKGVPGVADARVDLTAESLTVTTDGSVPAPALRDAIAAAVKESGYGIAEDDFQ